jgi:hypothetical protein
MYNVETKQFVCDGCQKTQPPLDAASVELALGPPTLPGAPDGWSILNLRFAVCGDACRLTVLRANALRQDPTWTPSTNDPALMSSLYAEATEEEPLDLGLDSPAAKPLLTDRVVAGLKKLVGGRR